MVFVIDQSQKEELDRALKMAADMHSTEKGALETENLSDLSGLKEELQTLRTRVAELTKFTGMMREWEWHMNSILILKLSIYMWMYLDRVCTFNSQKIEQDENEVVGFFPSFYLTVQKFVVSKIYFKSK